MTTEQSYLRRGTVIMIATAVGGFAADYALNVGVASLLAAEDYGDFKVAMAFLNISALAVLLGGDRAAPRFLASWLESDDGNGVWEYARLYLLIMLGLSVLLIAATFVVSWLHFGPTDLANRHPLIVAAVIIPLAAASTLLGRVFQAAKRIDLANLPWRVGFPLAKLSLVLVVAYVVGEMTDINVLWLAFVTAVLLLTFQIVCLRRLGLVPVRRDHDRAAPRAWLAASIPMMLVTLIVIGINQVDIFVLELIADERDVGYFGAVSTTVHVIYLAQTATVGLLSPLISKALDDGQSAIGGLHTRGFRLLICLTVPLSIGVAVFASSILSLFGSVYVVATDALLILTAGFFVSTVLGLSAIWLQYSGNERLVMWVMLGALVSNIVLNFILIPIYGINGAAAGTTVVLVAMSLTLCLMMRRQIGVSPWPVGAALLGLFRRGGP
ncbi:MAG: flippase [Pseudomonadota bacterium]